MKRAADMKSVLARTGGAIRVAALLALVVAAGDPTWLWSGDTLMA